MKKLLCILAFLAAPMLMMGQEQGSGGTGTDPNAEVKYAQVATKYMLEGRKVIKKPEVKANSEKGVVVVYITVDSTGKVTTAKPDRGTDASIYLIDKARTAARGTTFDAGTDNQKGTITYNFTVTE